MFEAMSSMDSKEIIWPLDFKMEFQVKMVLVETVVIDGGMRMEDFTQLIIRIMLIKQSIVLS